MAKTHGPLLSFGASGTIGKTQTYASWKGVKYARQRVIPANPNTTAQQLTRNLFKNLSSMWLNGPAELSNTWNAQASGRPYTGRNHFMGVNIANLRGQSDMLQFQGSPGNLSGFPILSIAGVENASTDTIAVTLGLPTLPTGWTITQSVALAFLAVTDPSDDVGPIFVGTGITPFDTVTINGPDHTLDYIVSGWLEYQRPDGRTCYGPSLTAAASHA